MWMRTTLETHIIKNDSSVEAQELQGITGKHANNMQAMELLAGKFQVLEKKALFPNLCY